MELATKFDEPPSLGSKQDWDRSDNLHKGLFGPPSKVDETRDQTPLPTKIATKSSENSNVKQPGAPLFYREPTGSRPFEVYKPPKEKDPFGDAIKGFELGSTEQLKAKANCEQILERRGVWASKLDPERRARLGELCTEYIKASNKDKSKVRELMEYEFPQLEQFHAELAQAKLGLWGPDGPPRSISTNPTPKMQAKQERIKDLENSIAQTDKTFYVHEANYYSQLDWRNKQIELSDKYGITFAKPGDTIDREKGVFARQPTMQELAHLEQALESCPYAKGVHVAFTNKQLESQALAFWTLDKQDQKDEQAKRLIVIEPLGARETDPDPFRKKASGSLQDTLVHELTHDLQHQLGLLGDPPPESYMKPLGWHCAKVDGSPVFILEGKKPGTFFRQERDAFTFVRCDEKGNRLGTDTISASQLKEQVRVKPSSSYFPNPHEEVAEAMILYLSPDKSRRDFLSKENPQLFELCKKLDQQALDKQFGVGKVARLNDGRLSRN